MAALNNLALACARAGDGERALELTARALDALHAVRATAIARPRCTTTSPTCCTAPAAPTRRWCTSSWRRRAFAEIGGDADEMQPEVWMLVEW